MDKWKSKQNKSLLKDTHPAGRVSFLEIFGPYNAQIFNSVAFRENPGYCYSFGVVVEVNQGSARGTRTHDPRTLDRCSTN